VAFFGGSFDPPHLGHIAIARAAREALSLDRVLFAPVGLQPLKPLGSSASFEDRVAMTRVAVAREPAFEVSLLDAPRPDETEGSHPNFTIDTLKQLRDTLPAGAELFLLLGADSFRTLHHWHRAAEIPFLASLIVASRPASTSESADGDLDLFCCLPSELTCVPMAGQDGRSKRYQIVSSAGEQSSLTVLPNLHYDISATELRSQLHDGQRQENSAGSDQPLIDPAVLAYIRQHGLYRR
jgi:nicotinate-nucleotide adenylyltransferase